MKSTKMNQKPKVGYYQFMTFGFQFIIYFLKANSNVISIRAIKFQNLVPRRITIAQIGPSNCQKCKRCTPRRPFLNVQTMRDKFIRPYLKAEKTNLLTFLSFLLACLSSSCLLLSSLAKQYHCKPSLLPQRSLFAIVKRSENVKNISLWP